MKKRNKNRKLRSMRTIPNESDDDLLDVFASGPVALVALVVIFIVFMVLYR